MTIRQAIHLSRLLFAVVLTVLTVISARSLRAEELEPQLVLEETEFDFGKVKQGTVVAHNFGLINRGNAPLKIGKIHPACGCTAAVVDQDTIEPGARTEIKTSFDTTGFKGRKVKTIRLYTNDPRQSSAVLTIMGTVMADVVVEPELADFAKVPAGKTSALDIIAYTAENSSTKLLDARSHSPDLEVETQDYQERGRTGKKITLRLKDTLPPGQFRGRIALRTTDAKEPVVNIPVHAHVEGAMSLEPPAIIFGALSAPMRDPVVKEAVLRNHSGKPINIEKVESDNPAVQTEFYSLEGGADYTIRVSVQGNSAAIIRARLKIATDYSDKAQRNLVLPVYAIIEGKQN
ncbi:MAG TPA: DUF1573 domain-containing protein [Oligoflexia bacterium]|nr:DUF1573 domain-containing protein [Oligoflexia bacterium]